VLLGYLNPNNFAGGALQLDVSAAEAAVARIAERLGLSTIATAAGMHQVINARMADQIRLMTVRRGYDPRQFTLVLLGGAGPVHGVALAEELGIHEIVVPQVPGVLSAFGLLAAAIEHHHARTLPSVVARADLAVVNALLASLDEAGRMRMCEEKVPLTQVRVTYAADMRYVGQAYELEVPINAPLCNEDLAGVQAAFHAVHAHVYGYHRIGQPVEFINFRAVHTYPLPRPSLRPPLQIGRSLTDARIRERQVYFAPAGFIATPIFDRARLPAGKGFHGPAIVEQPDTTTVIPPGYDAYVEECCNLRIHKESV
jgi:N-methylhydantoinase A